MKTMKKTVTVKNRPGRLRRFLRATGAVSALEYAILVGVVAVASVGLMGTFSTNVKSAISQISQNLGTLTAGTGNNPPPATP